MGLLPVVRRPSVRRPCRNYLWTECTDFFQILVVASPGPYAGTFFEFKKKTFSDFLRFFFLFLNMGPYGSENFKTLLLLQIVAKSFQTFPEFSYQWSSQNYFWDFWNFENWNFNNIFFFINMGPYGSKYFKTLLLLQIAACYNFENRPVSWNPLLIERK